MKLKPLGDRLIVKPVEEEETTASGIVLPDTAKEKPQKGKVMAVGDGEIKEDGSRRPLDVGEGDLDSRRVALLRAVGLGVNSATFSEFKPGERICTECAGHEVTCDVCGRELDAYLDGGEYRGMNEDEAYVCSVCRGRLEDQLEPSRDW